MVSKNLKILKIIKIPFSWKKQIIFYILVGLFSTFSNWLIFFILKEFYSFSTLVCSIVFYFYVLLFIFPLQKFITFNKYETSYRGEIFKFWINHSLYVLFDFALTYFFVDINNFTPGAGKFISLLIMTPISFLSQKFWIFKNK